MSDRTLLIVVVAALAGYWLFLRNPTALVATPATRNPVAGTQQVASQDTFSTIMGMINSVVDTVGNIQAQTSASTT